MVIKQNIKSDISEERQQKSKLEKINYPKFELELAKKPEKAPVSPGKGWSLSNKAKILSALLGALPVIVIGSILYGFVGQTVSRQIAEEKIAEVEQISGQISLFLTEKTANIKTLVNLVTDYITPDLEKLSPEEKKFFERTLSRIYRDYQVFDLIALYDLQGDVIVQSQASAPEENQKENAYFQKILATKNLTISEPILDDNNNLAIHIAVPVNNKKGKLIGVLAGHIPVNYMGNAVLKTSSLREGTTYRLIDSEGKIFQNIQDPEELPLGSKIAAKLPLFERVNGSRTPIAWKQKFFNAYAPITSNVNLDWSLVTSTDLKIAFTAQRQLGLYIILGTVITAISTAIIGGIIANYATKPIIRITETVEKLTQGELGIRVAVTGNDELAILGKNINQMTEKIQGLLATLRLNSQELERQNEVLANLAKNEALILGNARIAAQAFTEASANTLDIERVSIWLYNPDRTNLSLLDLYDRTDKKHYADLELNKSDFPEYFQLLASNSLIIEEDAQKQTATWKRTSSILDQPVQIAGVTIGIIRCEQVKEHTWTPQELNFISSVANLASLAVENERLQGEIAHILDTVSAMERGDFTVRAKVSERATGVVADILNSLLEELVKVLQQVLDSAQEVSQGAGKLEAIAETVAKNAEKQAESVTQVLSLSEQVEDSAQNSASEVKTTNQSLLNLKATINVSEQTIANLTHSIEILQQSTERIIRQMKTLGEFVGLADQFVQEQSEIVQQTQVLALNAALVAARAAEQKNPMLFEKVAREFEGIADQVGKLATQTSERLVGLEARTAQIHNVVSAIDIDVQSLGGLVNDFTQGVQQTEETFKDIQTVTQQTIEAGESVAHLTEEIDRITQKTVAAMRDIAVFAQQTAQLTQKTLLQSEGIDSLSVRLLTLVKFFKLPENQQAELEGKTIEVNSTKV